eukprot:1912791-Prorocentrum_lima.AAC.1
MQDQEDAEGEESVAGKGEDEDVPLSAKPKKLQANLPETEAAASPSSPPSARDSTSSNHSEINNLS